MVKPFPVFFILTIESAKTFEVSNLDSSIKRALAKVFPSCAILVSCKPCASFAASYSAFSDKSPLSLASAIAAEIFLRPSVFK